MILQFRNFQSLSNYREIEHLFQRDTKGSPIPKTSSLFPVKKEKDYELSGAFFNSSLLKHTLRIEEKKILAFLQSWVKGINFVQSCKMCIDSTQF